MKKLFAPLLCCLILAACKAHVPAGWQAYDYAEYDGTLYIGHTEKNGGVLHLVLCGSFSGIEASVKITHACTRTQFSALKAVLEAQGCRYLGEVATPDTSGYPDLSAYISMVFSSDELHELWAGYGLE
ncbi:MAG: hypothetical protein K6G80_11760 [Treponema sp.]|nr:hypothetical protein [Treponema sp.]